MMWMIEKIPISCLKSKNQILMSPIQAETYSSQNPSKYFHVLTKLVYQSAPNPSHV